MAVEILTRDDLNAFKTDLIQEIKTVMGQPVMGRKDVLKSKDVRDLLGISAGTLQTLRINGTLNYSKIGGTIFYERAEVMKVLQKNKHQNQKEITNG